MRAFSLQLAVGVLTACGEDSADKVDLSGSLTLWGSASTQPEFSMDCSGSGDYEFVESDTEIKAISGDEVKYEGKLASGRGGVNQECDFPFSGTLIVADEYTVELTGNGESLSAICSADQVPVHDRGSIEDVAFMHLRITEDGFSCSTPNV
jgi:hypothetical protein